MTILGTGTATTSIHRPNGDTAPYFRIFEIVAAGDLTVDGVTVVGGNTGADGSNVSFPGGGIYNAGIFTVQNSSIEFNITPKVINSFVVTGENPGGGIYTSGTVTIANSALHNNWAQRRDGGAIEYDSPTGVTGIITGSTFTNNSARSEGGAMCSSGAGTTQIKQTTLNTNSAGTTGGGIRVSGGIVEIIESTLNNNSAPQGAAISNSIPLRMDTVKTYTAATAGWDQATGNLVAPAESVTAIVRMNVSSLNATIYADDLDLQ